MVAADVTEARHHLPGAEAPSVIELRQGGGLARTLEVDPALAAAMARVPANLLERSRAGRERWKAKAGG